MNYAFLFVGYSKAGKDTSANILKSSFPGKTLGGSKLVERVYGIYGKSNITRFCKELKDKKGPLVLIHELFEDLGEITPENIYLTGIRSPEEFNFAEQELTRRGYSTIPLRIKRKDRLSERDLSDVSQGVNELEGLCSLLLDNTGSEEELRVRLSELGKYLQCNSLELNLSELITPSLFHVQCSSKIGLYEKNLALLQTGRKKTTIRYAHQSIKIPSSSSLPLVLTENQDGVVIIKEQVGMADITRVDMKPISKLTLEDAISDGFSDVETLRKELEDIYAPLIKRSVRGCDPITIWHLNQS